MGKEALASPKGREAVWERNGSLSVAHVREKGLLVVRAELDSRVACGHREAGDRIPKVLEEMDGGVSCNPGRSR